jgi:hypothetical protein
MTVTTDLGADLVHGTLQANGSIVYAAGENALVGSEPTLGFTVAGPPSQLAVTYNTGPLAQFLTQRALEREQAKIEAMQAALLEKQRLRREVRYYAALQTERDKAAEELRRQEEEARQKAEAEARAKAEAEAQAQAEAEAKAKADEEARAKAEADAKAKADAQAKAEAEHRAADEAAKAQAEADRKKAEQAKLEAARKAAEQARKVDGSLPGVNDGSTPAPVKPKANPFTIDNLLKSLDGG